MMTITELTNRWAGRATEWRRLGVQVDGATVANEFLADLEELRATHALDAVSLTEASAIGGYSVDRLQHLVATGVIENVGRKHKPKIRRGEVPVKPGLRTPTKPAQLESRRRIVASVTTLDQKEGS